jgi:hypothetical protein
MSIDDLKRQQQEIRIFESICERVNALLDRFCTKGIADIFNKIKNERKLLDLEISISYYHGRRARFEYSHSNFIYHSGDELCEIKVQGTGISSRISTFSYIWIDGKVLNLKVSFKEIAYSRVNSITLPLRISHTGHGETYGYIWRDQSDNEKIVKCIIAMLEDKKVSADFNPDPTKNACFIASSIYGESSIEVYILQKLRDELLLTNRFGNKFVQFYYTISPPIAEYIKSHPILRLFVKCLLLPIVSTAKFLLPQKT